MITPDAAGWLDFDIPGGSEPVPIARLRYDDASRAQTLFVRFPAGWRRDTPGFYEAAEELIVLTGVLHMSGATFGPGDWAYVPGGAQRHVTATPAECLVFARFDGPARWRASSAAPGPPLLSARLEGEPRVLRRGDREDARLARLTKGMTLEVVAEVLEIASGAYAFVDAGEPAPCGGPCFVRTFGGEA